MGSWISVVNDISCNGNLFVSGGSIFVSGIVSSSGIIPTVTKYFSDTTMQGNVTIGGNLFVNTSGIFVGGTLVSNGTIPLYSRYMTDVSFNGNVNVVTNNASTSATTGALVVSGGMGIQGNTYVGSMISSQQFTQKINTVTWSTSPTISFLNGMITVFTGTVSGAITSLSITSLPVDPLTSYTFTFMIPTGISTYYITATPININGASVTLNSQIGTLAASGSYISQQITIMNTGTLPSAPSFIATTSAYRA